MKRIHRLRDDNKPSFLRLFQQFCDETKWGNADELTATLYGQFVVEDFQYSDDSIWFGVENYLKTKVIPHKIEVFNAGIELNKVLPRHCGIEELEFVDNLWLHDLSKFSAVEALGYSGWNFETNSGDKQGFDVAWNHHKNHNEHHPEYWLSVGRGGEVEPLRMPNIYVAEMVADWIGAGKTYGSTLEEWLPNNLHKFKMHPDSLNFLHEVLNCIGIDWKRLTDRQPVTSLYDEPELEPDFGWCDVLNCTNPAVACGVCWPKSGYWCCCSKHYTAYRMGVHKPQMESNAVDREARRKEDGLLAQI